jgi:hypothetical protein
MRSVSVNANYVTSGYVASGYLYAPSNVLAGASIAIVQLVHLGFPTAIALNTSTWDLTWGGVTYKGAYGLGQVSAITDKPGEVQGITLELAGGDSAVIALALDDADQVQGTPCTIRTAIMDATSYQILDAPVEWTGTLDTMGIAEDGNSASIRVTAESRAVDLLRGSPWMYNDADQTAINASDRSFSFVADQIDKPVVWPAKSWFYK